MTPEQTPGTRRTTYTEVHGGISELIKKGELEEAQKLAVDFSYRTRQAVENREPLTFSDADNFRPDVKKTYIPIRYFTEATDESGV